MPPFVVPPTMFAALNMQYTPQPNTPKRRAVNLKPKTPKSKLNSQVQHQIPSNSSPLPGLDLQPHDVDISLPRQDDQINEPEHQDLPEMDKDLAQENPAPTREVTPPRTRELVINNVARTVCNGPVCRKLKGKDPPRNCSTCSFQYCKKCCQQYQRDDKKRCKQSTHAPDTRESSPSGGPGRVVGYNPTLPLRTDHYVRLTQGNVEYTENANRLTEQKAAGEALKRMVDIYFWKSVRRVLYHFSWL